MEYKIIEGDALELIKQQPDNSVDLIVTSPPYADIINYGKEVSTKKPDEYVDWFLPYFDEIYRVLKPSGSFILNINHSVKNGVVNPFVYELISRSQKQTKLKLYSDLYWHKKNGIPNGAKKRFRNMTEFVFHFVKNPKELKFYMERVMYPTKDTTLQRRKYDLSDANQGEVIDGERIRTKKMKYITGQVNRSRGDGYTPPDYYRELPALARPDNVFRFSNAGASRDNTIKHPAPFHVELPTFFINLLTDEGDIVMDIFSGIATTGVACKELNRNYIGYELNPKYVEFSIQRLEGVETDEYEVCQYDLEDNLIARYKNRLEASKATGVPDSDIMRTYNRTKFETRGGYKWTLEKKQK